MRRSPLPWRLSCRPPAAILRAASRPYAERAIEKTAAGVETLDVRAVLIADRRVAAGNIDVDTSASTKTVVLKGSVPFGRAAHDGGDYRPRPGQG